jgi:hypothetical protein
MRAKRVGADTFECPLILACQIIDMRVGLRLERAFRENQARPVARRRGRCCRCGWLRNAPKARCCKLWMSSAAAVAAKDMLAAQWSAIRSIRRLSGFQFMD